MAKSASADSILARNPFDHALGRDGPPDDTVESGEELRCSDVRVAAIVTSAEPEWSFAALATPAAGEAPRLHRRGGHLGAAGAVAWIGFDRVGVVRPNGAVCEAVLFESSPVPPASVATPSEPAAGTTAVGSFVRNVRKVGDREYHVDRGALERLLESPQELMAEARIAPHLVGGRIAGLRLVGLRRGSALGAIGLAEGDRLEAINGMPLTSLEGAVSAYARLREAESFTLTLSRDGKPMTFDYRVK